MLPRRSWMTSSSRSIRQPEKEAIVAEPAMSASPVLMPEAFSSPASPPRPSSGAAASTAMLLYASRPTSASGTPATEDHGPLSTSAQPPPVAAHSVSTPPPPPSLSQLRKPVSAAPRVASAETTVRPCRASSSGAALALRATPRHRAGARVWRAVKGRSASPHATRVMSTAATRSRIPDGTPDREAVADKRGGATSSANYRGCPLLASCLVGSRIRRPCVGVRSSCSRSATAGMRSACSRSLGALGRSCR